MYPKIPLAQSIIEICQQKGVQHIVISPGSRNAPLTIGFTNNPFFKCYSIADERCAAFFALGIAQQIQKPVVVVCTSGSALLNYYPAIAEAFYSQIPLIVISADRPQNKIDIGDGQTIRQKNVFANHSLYNANLQENVSTENDNHIQMALHVAVTQKGPVHINAPFEEPLPGRCAPDGHRHPGPAGHSCHALNRVAWGQNALRPVFWAILYPDNVTSGTRLCVDWARAVPQSHPNAASFLMAPPTLLQHPWTNTTSRRYLRLLPLPFWRAGPTTPNR